MTQIDSTETAPAAAPGVTRHLGMDLGVTNLKWSVVEYSGDGWRTLDRGQLPTRADEGPNAVVERIGSTGREVGVAWPGIVSAGIGVPGLFNPRTGCTRSLTNMPGAWADRPVAAPVSAALGVPVVLINDARAFGLAELRLGAGRGVRTMVGITLGTGVGGVIAIDGRVHMGTDGTAGEVGHQTIDPDGPWCNCGNRGCLEAYVRADQIAAACGTATVEEAIAAARSGDARALSGLADVGRYLGIGIANLITLITPERVVIGGGIAAGADVLFDAIRSELRRRVRMTALEPIELVTAALGTWAGSIGAAVHGAEAQAAAMTAAEAAP